MRSLRIPVPTWLRRSAASSAFCFSRAASARREASIFIARSLFLYWLRSSWHSTTMPVGRCVMRMALSVLFTCWPPAPEERKVSICRSAGSSSTSTSSTSGSTATVAVEVWMRPPASVSGTRCTRWTPDSYFSRE